MNKADYRRNSYMRHSTLVPWLQKGQLNTVSSLSILFLGAGFALDFLFPIIPSLKPSLQILTISITNLSQNN